MEKNTKLNGTWENDVFRLIIKGDKYVSLCNGFRYGKGTIMYDDENFTLTSSHAYWLFFLPRPFVESVNGKYIFADNAFQNEIIISDMKGRYGALNGIWIGRKSKK